MLDPTQPRNPKLDAAARQGSRGVTLGCGGFILFCVLLVGGSYLYEALTDVDLDAAALQACSSAELGSDPSALVRVTSKLKAIQAAQRSNSDGLRDAVGEASTALQDVDLPALNQRFARVAEWCTENDED